MSVEDPVLSSYQWLVVVGALAAFFYGFGTGSNDVANAFGTSVGAKTLTLKQAVVIAAIFEFTGAIVLGRVSTSVIAGGIAETSLFAREPEFFAYGMVCAMSVSGIWQVVASYLEVNVSSTHSIIGSILGFSLVYGGAEAVNWKKENPAAFPPYSGVVPIIVSWFFSPILTATASAIMFFVIRFLVLRRKNGYTLSFWLLPPLVTFTVFICVFFVFSRGAKKTFQSSDDEWSDSKSAWIAACVAAGCGVLTALICLPLLKYYANKRFNEDGTLKEDDEEAEKAAKKLEEAQKKANGEDSGSEDSTKAPIYLRVYNKMKYIITYGTSVDIHAVVEEDEVVAAIHKNAEVFDAKIEYAFKYLQVFSAICVVFSHGAGEVGYMAGPLTAVWAIYTEGKMFKSVEAPIWAILIGALGLVIGLATYGYNVTRAMGVRLAKLSPSRGFVAELSTALVIMICSQYGLPTSSSQCITGGIIGVGLTEGRVGVNWKFFAKQFASWISTLFIAGLGTAALFAQGVYSPSIQAANQVTYYEDQLANISRTMVDNYQRTLISFRTASQAGAIPTLTFAQWNAYNASAARISTSARTSASAAQGTVDPSTMVSYVNQALSIYQTQSILTVGQVELQPNVRLCNNNVTADIQARNLTFACPAPRLLASGVPVTWPPAVPTTGRR